MGRRRKGERWRVKEGKKGRENVEEREEEER